jgi:hypothetical protein
VGRRKGWACLRIGLERGSCRMEWALQSTPARRRRLVPPPLVQGQLTWVKPRSAFLRRMHHSESIRKGSRARLRKNIQASLGHHLEKRFGHHARRILLTKFERFANSSADVGKCGSACRSKSLRLLSTGHIRASPSDRPAQVAAVGRSRPRQPQRPLSLSLPCHLERCPRLSQ